MVARDEGANEKPGRNRRLAEGLARAQAGLPRSWRTRSACFERASLPGCSWTAPLSLPALGASPASLVSISSADRNEAARNSSSLRPPRLVLSFGVVVPLLTTKHSALSNYEVRRRPPLPRRRSLCPLYARLPPHARVRRGPRAKYVSSPSPPPCLVPSPFPAAPYTVHRSPLIPFLSCRLLRRLQQHAAPSPALPSLWRTHRDRLPPPYRRRSHHHLF